MTTYHQPDPSRRALACGNFRRNNEENGENRSLLVDDAHIYPVLRQAVGAHNT